MEQPIHPNVSIRQEPSLESQEIEEIVCFKQRGPVDLEESDQVRLRQFY